MKSMKETTPAQIKKLYSKNSLIFSLKDAIVNPSILGLSQKVENDFENLVQKIKSKIANKPSSTPRKDLWRIGREITRFRDKIKKEHGVYITNLIEAIAQELDVSENFVRYILKFSEFSLLRQVDEKIPWSTYMEALNLSNKKDFQHCIQLIKEGKLKSSREVREYVKSKNKGYFQIE